MKLLSGVLPVRSCRMQLEGRVGVYCDPSEMAVAPQSPYCFTVGIDMEIACLYVSLPQLYVQGTLRENLLYPETAVPTTSTPTTANYQRLADEVSKCQVALLAAGLSSDDFLHSLPAPVSFLYQSARLGSHTDTLEIEEERKDWSRCCSLGEQQRIAAARLLMRRPLLVRMRL